MVVLAGKKARDCAGGPETDIEIVQLAEALKAISEPHRLKILCYLGYGERCVFEVKEWLGISQQLTSFHLRTLRDMGFLKSRRERTSFYYSIDSDFLRNIEASLDKYVCYGVVEKDKATYG